MIRFSSNDVSSLVIQHDVAIDTASGSAVTTVPIPLRPGRSGFAPQLGLSYTSAPTNSAYGIGWSLTGTSFISVSTQNRLPSYDERDNYVINGAEEIVPSLVDNAGHWEPKFARQGNYNIYYYRTQTEKHFRRIERWQHTTTQRIFWLLRESNGVVSVYGYHSDNNSRLFDSQHPEHVFMWLLEAQYDGNGNAIFYDYLAENHDSIDSSYSYEYQRVLKGHAYNQRYLKRIRYGNTHPLTVDNTIADVAIPGDNRWLFEVVFDFGDHDTVNLPSADITQPWPVRPDPHSTFRPGFEVRTYRLCRRILLFHYFDELDGAPVLVSAMGLEHHLQPAGSQLERITYTGYRNDNGSQSEKAIPALKLDYTQGAVASHFKPAKQQNIDNLPAGLTGSNHRWVDLFGEGLPGVLTETRRAWYYKSNMGDGQFSAQQTVIQKPSQRLGQYAISDFNRDGNLNLVILQGRGAGYCEYDRNSECWSSYRPFPQTPHFEGQGKQQWIDLNGSGQADILISKQDRFTWYAAKGKEGFDAPIDIPKPSSFGGQRPQDVVEDRELDLYFVDMTGDGSLDLVQINNGRVTYFPQLGNGHFGDGVEMADAPFIDDSQAFDHSRLRFVDLDGSGTSDIIYIGRGKLYYWINAWGNRFVDSGTIDGLPYIDNVSNVRVLDFLGNGIPCLVWSSPLLNNSAASLHYLELTEASKPRLLNSIDNSMGRRIELEYGNSSEHYLRDKNAGTPWITKLPTHRTVVNRKIILDDISHNRIVTRFEYHDGHFDSEIRTFRGFGWIDQYDSEHLQLLTDGNSRAYAAPACTRTWMHNGELGWFGRRMSQFYQADGDHNLLPGPFLENPERFDSQEFAEAYRGLAGKLIRQEVYAVEENGQRAEHPFQVLQRSYRVRRLQPERITTSKTLKPVLFVYLSETLSHDYEQQATDPRIAHHLSLTVDDYGYVRRDCDINYPRRSTVSPDTPLQQHFYISCSDINLTHLDESGRYQLGISIEERAYEIQHLLKSGDKIFDYDEVVDGVDLALTTPLAFHESYAADSSSGPQARLVNWDQSYYWNNDRSAPLALGGLGNKVLIHHEESACFSSDWIEDVYGDLVDNGLLQTDGLYHLHNDYWWQQDAINHYLGLDGFYLVAHEQHADGGLIQYQYDPYSLVLQQITDSLGNQISCEIDYHLLTPKKITDFNGNFSEVLHDPLGVIIATSNQGQVVDDADRLQLYGNGLINGYTLQADASFNNLLTNPAKYLQEMSQCYHYDLDSWETDHQPTRAITLVRETFLHDGHGNINNASETGIFVNYFDGFQRELQSKLKVEAGPAIQRDAIDAVIVDDDQQPVTAPAAERWLVSGHKIYNNKQQTIRQYESFYSAEVRYEGDTELHQIGQATHHQFDAIGRLIESEMADGTINRLEISPWSMRQYDANDSVLSSRYKTDRDSLSNSDPEKIALNKSLAHADTPLILHKDPLGRDVLQVQIGEGGLVRSIQTSMNHDDTPATITDARGLVAFQYRRDMLGRALYESSIDAGQRWHLLDAMNQLVHLWDGRGVHEQTRYDPLGRTVSAHVEGLGLDQITERYLYGDDPTVVNPERNNSRGRLIRHYDQAGVIAIEKYDPAGMALKSTRQLCSDYQAEPDWGDPAAVAMDAEIYTSESVLDAAGRKTQFRTADGSVQDFHYYKNGQMASVRLTTADGVFNQKPIVTDTAFNQRGQRTDVHLGNGVEIHYDYDPDHFRLQRIFTTRNGGADTLQDIHYTYDAVGNIVRLVDQAQEPAASPAHILQGLSVSSVNEYTYDAFYELKQATGRVHQALLQHDYRPQGGSGNAIKSSRHLSLNNGMAVERYSRNYFYDIAGNLSQVQHLGSSQNWNNDFWTSPTSNRSLQSLDHNNQPVTDRENRFDANGNNGYLPHLRSLDWSYRNTLSRAVSIDRSASGEIDDAEYYVYGSDGIRVRKITERLTSGTIEVTERIYLDGCEIKRVRRNNTLELERHSTHIGDDSRKLATLHQWTADQTQLETDDIGQKWLHYQLGNHLGSSSLELDDQANIISYEEYFPFGGTAFIAGDRIREVKIKVYRYSGKERDDSTGLYCYEHRYYAPWIGNWLSPDPTGPKDSVNLYLFVHNNPINMIDPNGLETSSSTEGLQLLGTVDRGLTEAQAMAQFNASQGLFLGIRATDLVRINGGRDWRIVSYERITRPPQIQAVIDEFGGDIQRAYEVHQVRELVRTMTEGLEQFNPDAGLGGLVEGEGEGEGGEGEGQDEQAGNQATDANGRTTGDEVPQEDETPGGESPASDNASGTGAGQQGSGTGGGGESDERGTGTQAGGGPGAGTAGTGTGSGSGGQPGGVGAAGDGSPNGSEDGSENGSETGTRPAGEGEPGDGSNTNGTGEGPGGSQAAPGANSSDSQTHGGEGGNENPHNLPTSGEGIPAPPGATRSGDDPNGTLEGTLDGTSGGTGGPGGHPQGSRTEGPANGQQGGNANGERDGEGGNGRQQETTTLDTITRYAGYWHLEFGDGDPNGESGGIPGGMGSLNLGAAGQIAFLVLTVADIALTIASFGGLAALKTGLRLGVKALGRLALRAGRGLLTLGKRMIRGAVSGVARLGRRLWTGGRQLLDDVIDFAARGRTTRSFERAPFGQFRWRDLSIGLGDWRVRVNSIWLDPGLRGMNRLATFLHEGVHWTSNQFLPNLARMKHFTNNSGIRGFIGSNVKFYEESVAYTVGGIVGTFSRQGFKTRWREIIGFIPAWQRSLRNKSIARRHVIMGLPFVAGGGYGLYQAWESVFGDDE